MITTLKDNEVFVFGSNTAGRHGAGAAKQAAKQFGAEYGVGEGLTGQCYAFPTLYYINGQLVQRSMSDLIASRNKLYQTCRDNPDKTFLLTQVGCGLGGYPIQTMAKLFQENGRPENLVPYEDWTDLTPTTVVRSHR